MFFWSVASGHVEFHGELFDSQRKTISCSLAIPGYATNGFRQNSMSSFYQMWKKGLVTNSIFCWVLVSTEGFYDSVRTKCVHELKSPGLVSWNAIINGYRINGHGEFFLSSMRCGIVGKILIAHRNRAFWVLVIMQGWFKDVMVIFSQVMKDIKQVQAKILVSVSLTC